MPTIKKSGTIIISGSLAHDHIMDFPGLFKDHILPTKIHSLNVCFPLSKINTSFGGTAGNIAYNLSLLQEKPLILAVVGQDFDKYAKWLRQNKINLTQVKIVKNALTAAAYIMTDQADNQITGFYPGPSFPNYPNQIKKIKNIKLAIIAPDHKDRMLAYARLYEILKIPFIFDPGQQTPLFNALELSKIIKSAKVLIGNDYEIALIENKLKINRAKLTALVEILIITKGSQGSEIYYQSKKIIIPAGRPKNTSDPTGAGDAYRAGIIKGLVSNWDLVTTGRLASTLALYTVEKYGTQTHTFTYNELMKRFRQNYPTK